MCFCCAVKLLVDAYCLKIDVKVAFMRVLIVMKFYMEKQNDCVHFIRSMQQHFVPRLNLIF